MKKFKDRMEFRPLVSLLVILLICGILSGGSFFPCKSWTGTCMAA